MSKFIPDYVFDSIYDITPEILQSHGIRAALIDLDGHDGLAQDHPAH